MKIELCFGEDYQKKNINWTKKSFNMLFDDDLEKEEVYINFYNVGGGEKIACFSLALSAYRAVGVLERLEMYDKTVSQTVLLQNLLDYLYHFESPYFKILGLFCNIKDCGIKDSALQSVGFYTNDYFVFNHLHPEFLEVLNAQPIDEEIKEKFKNKYMIYCEQREKYISKINMSLEQAKRNLEYYEIEKNQEMVATERQRIAEYETILAVTETKGFYR